MFPHRSLAAAVGFPDTRSGRSAPVFHLTLGSCRSTTPLLRAAAATARAAFAASIEGALCPGARHHGPAVALLPLSPVRAPHSPDWFAPPPEPTVPESP